uniref:Uncharacterized protein n=1 Tax=Tanacetum cinerariifolium TaxID=118510 RepID=A0A6L2L690_TANCI|nr:hypothetical protein [Tanacetum cinerariifolium]
MEGYGNDNVTFNPTQNFSVHNWALKKNQPEGPPFTPYMLAICNVYEPLAFKAPKTSSKDEKKESNRSQPLAFTPVVARLHNEYHQEIGSPTSLGVTSEEGANPKLSSVVSASITKPVYSASTILHSKSASGHDASAAFTAKADPGKTDPNDSTKTKSTGDGLKNRFDDALKVIKLEDLSKLVQNVKSNNQKLKKLKTRVEAEVAFLSAQPSYLNMELPAKFLSVPGQVSTAQAKIKTLDALLSLLSKVTKALDRFAKAVEPASQKDGEFIKKDKSKKSMSSKDGKEEDTRSDSGKDANLTGSMVESSKQKKLKKFDFVTEEGDRACSKRTRARWNTIFSQIQTRMDYLHKSELELDIDFNKPLSEQDPILKLNDLAINKRMLMIFMTTSGRILSPLKTLDISQMKCCTLYKKSSSDFIMDLVLMIMPGPSVPFYLMKLIKGT